MAILKIAHSEEEANKSHGSLTITDPPWCTGDPVLITFPSRLVKIILRNFATFLQDRDW